MICGGQRQNREKVDNFFLSHLKCFDSSIIIPIYIETVGRNLFEQNGPSISCLFRKWINIRILIFFLMHCAF